MSLWQVITALVIIGGAAYTYVFQPMALELGVPRLQCWLKDGVYLRATVKETGYAAMMNQTPENKARLQRGEAEGCFNQGSCALTPNEALSALEAQILNWATVGGGNLLKGNILNMMGMRSEAEARAKQAEAEYCMAYLGDHRRDIEKLNSR